MNSLSISKDRSETYAELVLQAARENRLDRMVTLAIVVLVTLEAEGKVKSDCAAMLTRRIETGVGISIEEMAAAVPEFMYEGLILAANGIVDLNASGKLNKIGLCDLFDAIATSVEQGPTLTPEQIKRAAEFYRDLPVPNHIIRSAKF